MAKKSKKKPKKKDTPGTDAVGAVRTAVERTFHATADSAQSTRSRAQDLVDEVAGAAGRLREMVEQIGVLEDLKKQVEGLSQRVAALEKGSGAARSAASRSTASRSSSGAAKKKPAAKRSPAKRKAAAKRSSGKRKPAARSGSSATSSSTASRSSRAKKPA